MRKRTVQSVLARRSMFNNGGMVSPPDQATGILGSSPSLIDAVSNDALSDMGGGTLSMAQGGAAVNMQPSYVFNQGGIAKFDNGGMSTNNVVVKVLNGTATAEEIRAIEQSPFMERPEVAQAVRLYRGREPGGPLPLRPDVDVAAYMAAKPGEQLQNNKATDLKVGNLTDADRAIPTQMASAEQDVDTNKLRQMGFPESEIIRLKKLGMTPLSAFMKPATDRNAQSPGEEAIVNMAQSALEKPVPQFDEPDMGGPVAGPGDASVVEVNKQGIDAVLGAAPDGSPAPEISVTTEELPPVFDSSGDQGEGPPTVATTQEVDDQNQLFANLAEATNKNTETNAVDAVVAVSNAMGGEGGAVGGDGVMVTDTITGVEGIASNVVVDKAIAQNEVNTDEDVKAAAIDKVELAAGKASETGDPNDINALTKRIQGLLPAIKDDPQTEGLLIAMLGAAIAGGTSSNAMKNIADGMQKALPALINYRTKQKGAKEGRQQKIAAIVIGEQLKRETEDRAVSRTIAKEGRLSEAKRKVPTDYMFGRGIAVPKSALGLTGEGNIAVPAGTTLSLNQIQKEKLSKIIPNAMILPLKNFKYDMDDIKSLSGKGPALTIKQQNSLYSPYAASTTSPWEKYDSNFRPNYARPKQAMVQRLVAMGKKPTAIMLANDRKALTVEYTRLSGNYGKIYKAIDELKQMDSKKLVGLGGLKGNIGDVLTGIGDFYGSAKKPSVLRQWGSQLLEGADLSDITKGRTRGRLLLAKITPLLLGESGKTISDADRIRVARALGFTVETGLDDRTGKKTFIGVSGFDSDLFANPNKIDDALEQVGAIIAESYADIHNIYRREVQQLGEVIKEGDQKNPMKKGFLTFDATKGPS